jgi:Skp family chaperone for outer membrane proteins
LIAALAAILLPGTQSGAVDYKQLSVDEMVPVVEGFLAGAEAKLLEGAAAVETLLKSSKTDASQMTGKWRELVEQAYNGPEIRELAVALSNLQQEADSVAGRMPAGAAAASWKKSLEIAKSLYYDAEELVGFAREIQSVGEAVAWTLKVNRHIEALEKDIEAAPVRVGAYVEQMKAVSATLDIILRQGNKAYNDYVKGGVGPGNAKGEFSRYLEDLIQVRAIVQNASASLTNTSKYLESDGGWVIPETELKRMENLAEYWRDASNLYPLVKKEITAAAAGWAPLPKASWSSYQESVKEFNKVYGPLLEGDLFKGIRHFEGKKYPDLPAVVTEAETIVRTVIAALDEAEKNLEKIKKALEDDAKLTAKEQEEVARLEKEYGPEAQRIMYRASFNRGQWFDKMTNLILLIEQFEKSGSTDNPVYRQAKEAYREFEEERNPDQVAAKKVWDDFQTKKKDAQKRLDEIAAAHAKRKAGLGLKPVIPGGKL